MTDATAGRGGVGIRLYTTGGELVRRNFDQVGDSGRKMWTEIAVGQKAANPAIRALSTGVNEAKTSVDGLASRAGPAGAILQNFGAAGIAAAAGLGGLAIALGKAQDAMQWAAELTDTADRIGVGVERLQAWNFVADEAGVSTSSLQANLEKLNGVLGAFKSGIGDAKLKPVFEELGITTEQMQNVQTADQLMMVLADTLGQVKDRALQVKFARSLGVEESLPILRLGSQGIRDLSDEAERLGLVMGRDVVKALDDADRELEVAQQRINATVRLAVAGLAEDFADLVGVIASAVVQLQRFDAQVQRLSGAGQRPGRSIASVVSDRVRGRTAEEGEKARDEAARQQPGWMTWLGFNQPRLQAIQREDQLRSRVRDLAAGTGEYAETEGGFDPKGHTGRSGKSSNSADRETEQRRQRQERYEAQRERLQEEILRSESRIALSLDEEAALDIDTIERERRAKLKEIANAQAEYARSNGLRGLTEVEAAQLTEANNYLAEQKKSVREWERRREVEAYRLKTEEDVAKSAVDMLEIESSLAKTQGERYRIEREILIATQAIARKREEARVAEDNNMSPADRAAAMARFDQRAAGQLTVFDHNEEERLRQQFKSYGREVVGAIQDGRIGEYIGDQLKAKLLDGALNALFGMLNGGGGQGSGGGGFWNTAVKFGLSLFGGGKSGAGTGSGDYSKLFKSGGGKAAGGDTRASFMYGAAEHGPELFMLSGNGHVSSAAETAKMVREMASPNERGPAGAGPMPVIPPANITINAQGADPAALKRVEEQLRDLNRSIEQRAVEAVSDYRARTHGG